VVTHPNNQGLQDKVDTAERKLRNPYHDAYLWIKGEFLDVNGMYECIIGRETVMKSQIQSEDKKKSD